ncbi:phage portal protein [Pseudogemmobacter humi]|uniref:Phage portal protein, lambda family n=1 Tax=Pseudogemmobacter humi TaxID=2483812 RepID=A0A3P5XA37_9RHOB|nr:phage portal protein [Pseudogemmobacter humi]VDC31412.1 Phage portal protein, lambda family [Pseudogemmobacter humi]
MNMVERAILAVAPGWAARRARARAMTAHYDGASVGRRTSSLRASRSDADGAARQRQRMSFFARDMVRNTPFAARAKMVITGNVIGDGVIPKVAVRHSELSQKTQKKIRDRGLRRIEEHLDTVLIDRAGKLNLYGLQGLIWGAVVSDGECLVRIHSDPLVAGAMPLQLEVLEADYLDEGKVGFLTDGGDIRNGIEYDAAGRIIAYWLFPAHPGSDWPMKRGAAVSQRVPAEEVLHIYRVDRPGQERGVTWLAPVMMRLQDLADHEDAQLVRQKIAACFAAFRIGGEKQVPMPEEIAPGMVYDLGDSEDVKFPVPPGVEAYDEFTRSVLRSIAAGLGISYESLTGDLAQVNFSSARMGRLEMDQNVSGWQHLTLIPQLLMPLSRLFVDAWQAVDSEDFERAGFPPDIWQFIALNWVPPRRIIVDPAREFAALREAVRSGFMSRQQVVRQLGFDPERLLEEQTQDKEEADRLGLPFDSDPRADVSRQSKVDDPGDNTVSAAEAARALGISVDDLRDLVDDLRLQEARKRK